MLASVFLGSMGRLDWLSLCQSALLRGGTGEVGGFLQGSVPSQTGNDLPHRASKHVVCVPGAPAHDTPPLYRRDTPSPSLCITPSGLAGSLENPLLDHAGKTSWVIPFQAVMSCFFSHPREEQNEQKQHSNSAQAMPDLSLPAGCPGEQTSLHHHDSVAAIGNRLVDVHQMTLVDNGCLYICSSLLSLSLRAPRSFWSLPRPLQTV